MNDNIRDRGTIKWTSIMLPEHVEALKRVFAEEEKKPKPTLDEQQIWENEAKIQLALHNDLSVEITVYENGGYVKATGKILFVETLGKLLRLDNDGATKIRFENIIDVTIL